jgi:serine/threonine-protein kinase RsbW
VTDQRPAASAATTTAETVTLRLPADPAYLVLVRTTAAGLGARLDLTIDELEDLRLAVNEAGGLLVAEASPDAELTAEFTVSDALTVRISATTRTGETPARTGFAWAVLSALADDVDTSADDRLVSITFSKRRGG